MAHLTGLAAATLATALAAAIAPATAEPRLSLPLDCEPGKTCFIQSYVDLDPGPGIRDYACGTATYDAHTGVDFRLLSAAAARSGVAVLASADGTVKGLRDGVDDMFLTDAAPGSVKGRECGNGVVLDHGGGWETQYCHMKRGSLAVAQGQTVTRGTRLGDVGYSGAADFAHVHLAVRRDGKAIDPFLPASSGGSCQNEPKGSGLWEPAVAAAFPYRNGELITFAFAGSVPDHNALERDHASAAALGPLSPALLVYARFVNLKAGDRIRIAASGPAGAIADETSAPLDRSKATYVSYSGKKRRESPWPSGRYEGQVQLLRDGKVVLERKIEHSVP